jgi:hypothetical protein
MSSNPVVPLPLCEPSTVPSAQPTGVDHDSQQAAFRRADAILAPTGGFRPIIERYLADVAARKNGRPLVQIRGSLALFFRYVVLVEGINDLDQIRPSTVTRFIEAERSRGIRNRLFIGRVATFFVWLISEGLYDRGNPVITRLQRRQMQAAHAA